MITQRIICGDILNTGQLQFSDGDKAGQLVRCTVIDPATQRAVTFHLGYESIVRAAGELISAFGSETDLQELIAACMQKLASAEQESAAKGPSTPPKPPIGFGHATAPETPEAAPTGPKHDAETGDPDEASDPVEPSQHKPKKTTKRK